MVKKQPIIYSSLSEGGQYCLTTTTKEFGYPIAYSPTRESKIPPYHFTGKTLLDDTWLLVDFSKIPNQRIILLKLDSMDNDITEDMAVRWLVTGEL